MTDKIPSQLQEAYDQPTTASLAELRHVGQPLQIPAANRRTRRGLIGLISLAKKEALNSALATRHSQLEER